MLPPAGSEYELDRWPILARGDDGENFLIFSQHKDPTLSLRIYTPRYHMDNFVNYDKKEPELISPCFVGNGLSKPSVFFSVMDYGNVIYRHVSASALKPSMLFIILLLGLLLVMLIALIIVPCTKSWVVLSLHRDTIGGFNDMICLSLIRSLMGSWRSVYLLC